LKQLIVKSLKGSKIPIVYKYENFNPLCSSIKYPYPPCERSVKILGGGSLQRTNFYNIKVFYCNAGEGEG